MPAHQRIRNQREKIGLSLDGLAERLRPYWPAVTKSHLSRIENGKRRIQADMIPWFAKALECRVEDLLDRKPE